MFRGCRVESSTSVQMHLFHKTYSRTTLVVASTRTSSAWIFRAILVLWNPKAVSYSEAPKPRALNLMGPRPRFCERLWTSMQQWAQRRSQVGEARGRGGFWGRTVTELFIVGLVYSSLHTQSWRPYRILVPVAPPYPLTS